MKYYVQIPLERPIRFPDVCPFSGQPSPSGTVRLKTSKTTMIIPLPGAIYHSSQTTRLSIPAHRPTAIKAIVLDVCMWLAMFGSIGLCSLLLCTPGRGTSLAVVALLGGPIVAMAVRFWRYLLLRKVQIRDAWQGFVEVRFHSKEYATQLSEMNRLAFDAR